MRQSDVSAITKAVGQEFIKLAEESIDPVLTGAARRIFTEQYEPELLAMEKAAPDVYRLMRVNVAGSFKFSYGGRQYVVKLGKTFPRIPGFIEDSETWVAPSMKLKKDMFSEEEADELTRAEGLIVRATRVKVLLEEFLGSFDHPRQIPFSLPQITPFLQKIDFRSRWYATPPPFIPQKRPRVVRTPNDELRQLVTEASILRSRHKETT